MNRQMCQPIANKTAMSEDLKVMERSLPNYLLYNDGERKEEAHHGSNTMRSPALYVSGRTWERILFLSMQRVKIRRSMSLYPSGMRRQASVIRFPARGSLGQNRRRC